MITLWNFLGALAIAGSALAFAGEYVPKSYYVIDQGGHKSDVVYFRSKRDVEMFPLLRLKRGGGSQASSQASASASSHASASSSASASANANANAGSGGPNFFGGGGDYNPSFIPQGFPDNFGGFGGNQQQHAGYNGPILFSRFGEDTGSGVHVSGSAQGEKGAFSSSSSSVDGNGKVKYSVQSGKY